MTDSMFTVGLVLLMICAFFGGLFIGVSIGRSEVILLDDDERNSNTRYIP